MKPLEFLGTSQDDLKNFPAEARRAAGFELHFVQQGLMPADWKPVPQLEVNNEKRIDQIQR